MTVAYIDLQSRASQTDRFPFIASPLSACRPTPSARVFLCSFGSPCFASGASFNYNPPVDSICLGTLVGRMRTMLYALGVSLRFERRPSQQSRIHFTSAFVSLFPRGKVFRSSAVKHSKEFESHGQFLTGLIPCEHFQWSLSSSS